MTIACSHTRPRKRNNNNNNMPPTANEHTGTIIGSSECVFESKPSTTITDFIKMTQPPLRTRTRKLVSWAPRIALAYSITHVNDMSDEDIEAIWYEQKDYRAFKRDCKREDKERKEENKNKNRWEGLVVRTPTRRCGPKLAIQDLASTKKPVIRPGLGRKQYSDSMLVRPRRQPSSPNSPTAQLLTTSEGLGGRTTETQNIHRWASSSMSCVNEVIMSPQAHGTAASKSTTREDRRTLTRNLSDSMLAMPRRQISPRKKDAESGFPEINKGSRYSLLQKQLSDSALVKPRRGSIGLLPLQQTAIEELEEDDISLLSFDSDEVASPSSQYGIFAGHVSDSVLSIPEGDIMSPPRANAVVEDNEDSINERSLRTMDLETDRIDYNDEKERSMSIQDIEIHCAAGSRSGESQQLQQSGTTATSEAETELSLSTACLFEGDLSISLSPGLGNQTKFLARCNDSLLLLHAEAGSRANNLRRQQSRRETRNEHSDPLLRLRAQGVRGKSLSEQMRKNRSESTLISAHR
jgi:hypothetical protein